MATIDWPTTAAFKPVLPYSFGVNTPKSGSRGFYSGEQENVGHLADRLLCSITFPPCLPDQAGQREALLFGALSNGDRFRFAPDHRAYPMGTARGTLTVAASALAGARSVQIQGAMASANLLQNSGFEIDSNSDGLADAIIVYYGALPANLVMSRVAGNASTFAQRISADVSAGNNVGITRDWGAVVAGRQYTLAIDAKANTLGMTPVLYIGWYTAGGVFISNSSVAGAPTTAWVRQVLTATAPATAALAQLYGWATNTSGATIFGAAVDFDNMQFEQGASGSYAGLPTLVGGDFLSIGGNLMQTAYSGVTGTDGGLITVPLVLPLARPLTTGAAVTLQRPTGVWQIDTSDGISFDYSAQSLQQGVTIQFRQVIL